MFDELWSEIQDSQGEIFDVIEYKEEWEKEEKFDVEQYINGNTDYWKSCLLTTLKKANFVWLNVGKMKIMKNAMKMATVI